MTTEEFIKQLDSFFDREDMNGAGGGSSVPSEKRQRQTETTAFFSQCLTK